MAATIDQDPDALLDIVLRMESNRHNDFIQTPLPVLGALNEEHIMPVYNEFNTGVFDDQEMVPHLTDLTRCIMDIDDSSQILFSPDATSIPPQGNFLDWTQNNYQPTNNYSCPQTPPEYVPLSFIEAPTPPVLSADSTAHGVLPSIQFLSQQHYSTYRPERTKPGAPKPKTRRRVTTPPQRKAANVRERRRMFNLNESFDVLRKTVPTFAYEKRLSRIETLRLAMLYITFMEDVLNGRESSDGNLRKLLQSGNFAGLTNSHPGPVGDVLNSAASRTNMTLDRSLTNVSAI